MLKYKNKSLVSTIVNVVNRSLAQLHGERLRPEFFKKWVRRSLIIEYSREKKHMAPTLPFSLFYLCFQSEHSS